MDIQCPNCGEPWDARHLRHEEPYEWGLSRGTLLRFLNTGAFEGPDDPVRQAAESIGWRYATNSPLSILQCPSCPKEPRTPVLETSARERQRAVAALAVLLDGDDDGFASLVQDL